MGFVRGPDRAAFTLVKSTGSLATIPLAILVAGMRLLAQGPPPSPDRPWQAPEERQVANDGKRLRQPPFRIEPDRVYTLWELIDLAESHNPQTRVAWENARAGAAALGIARSELYPTLVSLAQLRVDRV